MMDRVVLVIVDIGGGAEDGSHDDNYAKLLNM